MKEMLKWAWNVTRKLVNLLMHGAVFATFIAVVFFGQHLDQRDLVALLFVMYVSLMNSIEDHKVMLAIHNKVWVDGEPATAGEMTVQHEE